MAVLDQYGKAVRTPRKSGANTVWRNHFWHAASQDSATPYAPTRLDGIESLLPPYDWQTLLSGSRGMYANYGPVRSCTHQKADNTVGSSYLPEFLKMGKETASVEWARGARDWLMGDWFGISDVRGAPFRFQRNLWLDSVAVDRDGDVFYLLTQHAQSGLPATQHIPANRVRTGNHNGEEGEPIKKGPFRGATICNGVIKNNQGRSIAFRVNTGGGDRAEDYEDIPATSMRHIVDPEWHDQGRGIPAASHALRFVANSLQSHEWEHTAMMMLSSIGLIERNLTGMADEDEPTSTLGEADAAPTGDPGLVHKTFEGGTVRYFSTTNPGAGLESMTHDRPSEQWEAFQDRTIRFYCSGANWPYELIWKSNDVNGVTIRNIQERAHRAIRDRQAILDPHARSQVTYALRSAIALRLIPEPPDPSDLWSWRFRHPKEISIDPGRDTSAEISAIGANHTTLRSVVESRGSTLDEHMDEIIDAELQWAAKREEAGLESQPLSGTKELTTNQR